MHSRGRSRSNSAISLHELDGQLHSRVNHSSTTSGSRGPPSQDRDQGLNGDQEDDDYEHSQEPSEPRGVGSAGTAGSESGDASESSPPPWREKSVSRLSKAWGSHVSCEVDFAAARDHLALERTFLGYLRTSMAMSMLGTAIAQLFRITEDGPGFGYTRAGKPLATLCFAYSIATILLGAVRSWRHQHSLVSGRALTGGFEIHLLGIGTCLLLLVFLGMMIAIDTVQASHED
ncbi:hypothetical protein B0J13DRAFT_235249 [Dactylonectria estremocensis]|uniref:DUF202 domain-containing protein n=1 Tax=Dactylonectria estremocensis TaxID=1079267 RepID=A0A9P9JDB0_9HYPO|nr:hypothetical protein B0J13DRAFT_235249 [Dactylonectria estremocensis]